MSVLVLLVLAGLALFVWRELRAARRRAAQAAASSRRLTERLVDPREAAAVLLVQQASYRGALDAQHRQVILALMRSAFGASAQEADGLYGFGRMAVSQTGDAANGLRRLLAPVREHCTLEEMKDLIAMLEQVGETTGPMNDHQRRLVEEARRALYLDARA